MANIEDDKKKYKLPTQIVPQSRLGSKDDYVPKLQYGKFNGTLYLGILDQLVCSNCGVGLAYGALCQYGNFRWSAMCKECRTLHRKYEQRFIIFKTA